MVQGKGRAWLILTKEQNKHKAMESYGDREVEGRDGVSSCL